MATLEYVLTFEAAVCEACMLRFRLYLTAIAGAVRLALRTGVGPELRQPLGITISAVSWWVSSLSLHRLRRQTQQRERRAVRRLLAPAAVRGAVAPVER